MISIFPKKGIKKDKHNVCKHRSCFCLCTGHRLILKKFVYKSPTLNKLRIRIHGCQIHTTSEYLSYYYIFKNFNQPIKTYHLYMPYIINTHITIKMCICNINTIRICISYYIYQYFHFPKNWAFYWAMCHQYRGNCIGDYIYVHHVVYKKKPVGSQKSCSENLFMS
jgi:hypothetical protein